VPTKSTLTDQQLDAMPIGYADPRSACFVPEAMRERFAAMPAAVVSKLTRETMAIEGDVVRSTRARDAVPVVLRPATSPADFEAVLVGKRLTWIAAQQASAEQAAAQRASDARLHTCAVCRQVRPPGIAGQGTTLRRVHGVAACGDCAVVLDAVAVERLGAERLEGGGSRLDAARAVLERATASRRATA